MAYDFDRPFIKSAQLPAYEATDIEEARLYGKGVRAIEMSNAEYSARYRKLSADLTMNPRQATAGSSLDTHLYHSMNSSHGH